MLSSEVIRKIEEFVYSKPRSVQEISVYLKKNWRTVDRYIEEIVKDYGTLSVRVFREGTRGALKIVYWSSIEKVSKSVFQEDLEETITREKGKMDFAAFDIFQYVDDSKKYAWIKNGVDESSAGRLKEFKDILLQAKKQVLFFSGNLSFINFDDGKVYVFELLEELVKRNISIKIIGRVDWVSKENIEKVLSLNMKYGKELIEIRHRQQPLRATIIDNKLVNIKEVKEPSLR
ncbi:hypothetical protein J4405_06445, partial [Candidatus Woesearchaeota archaeon]|nr:hypothetical protein [Candidatus Woesearchaeota archaeon]